MFWRVYITLYIQMVIYVSNEDTLHYLTLYYTSLRPCPEMNVLQGPQNAK